MNRQHRILFEKPDIDLLREKYTVVDMHFHSRYSDGMHSIPEIAGRAQALGVGVAITDHNDIRGALEINSYPGILSIPGIEVTSAEGSHVLIYFYDVGSLKRFFRKEVVPRLGLHQMSSLGLPMEEIVARARHYRSLVVFAHPYCAAYTGVCNTFFSAEQQKTLFEACHGVEVLNASNLNKWNLQCALLGFNLDKSITGGSDGHHISHMARVVSYADCRPNRGAFLDAVKAKANKVVGKEVAVLHKMAANGIKLKNQIGNYPDLVEKNLKYSFTLLNKTSENILENVKRTLNGKAPERDNE
jgi:PHP domain